ncbi:MAG: AraC family transcriptional regulator [Ruminococcaceae bacterium]|nr:AraC family transcriptional regulator [Oscillospiraceae bacterium]
MKKEDIMKDKVDKFLFSSVRHTDVECVTHIHVTMEIVLVTSGELNMTINGKEYVIPAGYGTFIPPFEPHMFHSKKVNECHVLMFAGEIADYFSNFTQTHLFTRHIFPISHASLDLVNRILPNETNTVDWISAIAVIAPLSYDIICGCDFEERKYPFDENAYRILEYVNENFRENLTLDTVAHAVGVHPVTVSKIFTRHTGYGFSYYLQYTRCAYAAKLINVKSMTLSEIVYESGFGCIRSFNRAFLNVYGITPTEYKRQILHIQN